LIRNATNAEILLTEKTEQEYRNKGYTVFREAPLEFMSDFVADLVARKDDETIVIEVSTQAGLALNSRISELVERLRTKPGWSFELLLVGEPEKLDSPPLVQLLDDHEIQRRLDQAARAVESGLAETAFVTAWSALEAATRALIAEEIGTTSDITMSGHVLDEAVFLGVISRSDHDDLRNMMKYRNAIVHGFSPSDFGNHMVTDLIGRVKSILAESASPTN
jgi:hypothetical protein